MPRWVLPPARLGGPAALGLVVALCLVGCSPSTATQVIVRFDADQATRDRAQAVRITVLPSDAEPRVRTEALAGDGARVRWPFVQPLHPRGDDATRRFHVVGELLDESGLSFNRQVAKGGYTSGERREVRLYFESGCSDVGCDREETCVVGLCTQACVTPTNPGASAVRTPPRSCARFQRTITLSGSEILADLEGFPLLVSLDNDADLAEHASQNGADISFVGEGDQTLAHEILAFSKDEGRLIAFVRIPVLRAGIGHQIAMRFGDSSDADREPGEAPAGHLGSLTHGNVWPAFRAVWHLEDAPDGAVRDSGSIKLEGIQNGTVEPVAAVVGMGRVIGEERRTYVGGEEELNFSNDESFAVGAWAKVDPDPAQFGYMFFKGGGSVNNPGYALTFNYDRVLGRLSNESELLFAGRAHIPLERWMRVIMVVDRRRDELRTYVDGEEFGTHESIAGFDIGTSTAPGALGAAGGCCVLEGALDEVWIWEGEVSPELIRMDHRNQKFPSEFVTLGPLEILEP